MKPNLFDSTSDTAEWDSFVEKSNNGVFLHTRRFISYHGNRFVDQSLVFRHESGRIAGIFPAAQDPDDPKRVISHPGLTYGGLVYGGRTSIEEVDDMLEGALNWYRQHGVGALIYKVTPPHLHGRLSQIDPYLLWKRGGVLERRDLWNVIALGGKRTLSKGRKWSVKKARQTASISEDNSPRSYGQFHQILTAGLQDRHGVRPVHSLDDMLLLRDLFPNNISLWVARSAQMELLAGCWVFNLGSQAWHTQYIGSTEAGRDCFATDLLLETVVQAAEEIAMRHFSFGASTEQDGRNYNNGLFNYKAGFGYGSATHDFYMIDLARDA